MARAAPAGLSSRGSRASRPSAILDAAIAVFLEQGFSNASMAQVAARAHASKETIYNHFGSKEQLFTEMVEAMARRVTADYDLSDVRDPRASLVAFGRALLDLVLDPDTIALYRVLIAEVPRMPELGPTFDAHGPRLTRERLADYLTRATAAGTLACEDAELSARLLLSMLVGVHLQRALIGVGPGLPPEARKRWVESGVDLFLARYVTG
jgi:AcrR family transcriptional regulator